MTDKEQDQAAQAPAAHQPGALRAGNTSALHAGSLSALPALTHAFFTRRGGVSPGIYEGLNCGYGSKDDPANIDENRARIAALMACPPEQIITPFQIHSPKAVIADKAWPRADAPEADAIVTKEPGLAIGILTADCAPLLFACPKSNVIAAAHSGWRGALGGVIEATLDKMQELGAARGDIRAAIGPTISQPNYEVGDAFKANLLAQDTGFERENEAYFSTEFGLGSSRKPHFDLPGYICSRLKRAHITHIENLARCTYESESLFFSFRRTTHQNEPDYGRQISLIMLNP